MTKPLPTVPPKVGTIVKHKIYGNGVVIAIGDCITITIKFELHDQPRTVIWAFAYPNISILGTKKPTKRPAKAKPRAKKKPTVKMVKMWGFWRSDSLVTTHTKKMALYERSLEYEFSSKVFSFHVPKPKDTP